MTSPVLRRFESPARLLCDTQLLTTLLLATNGNVLWAGQVVQQWVCEDEFRCNWTAGQQQQQQQQQQQHMISIHEVARKGMSAAQLGKRARRALRRVSCASAGEAVAGLRERVRPGTLPSPLPGACAQQ